MFCTHISLFKPIRTVLLTICVCFPDVVNLNLKSTLRVLYNLFTNYKSSDWTLITFTFIPAEATLCWPSPPLDAAGDHLGPESLRLIAFFKKKEPWGLAWIFVLNIPFPKLPNLFLSQMLTAIQQMLQTGAFIRIHKWGSTGRRLSMMA